MPVAPQPSAPVIAGVVMPTPSSLPPPPRKSGVGRFLLFFLLFVGLGLAGVRFVRPDLFARGVEIARVQLDRVQVTLGMKPPGAVLAEGPPFDTPAAGAVLERAAEQASRCQEPSGPTGRGRVKVLYDPSGKAVRSLVSEPFNDTSVGRCLVDLFSQTRVPRFGGEPVVVSKTFTVR